MALCLNHDFLPHLGRGVMEEREDKTLPSWLQGAGTQHLFLSFFRALLGAGGFWVTWEFLNSFREKRKSAEYLGTYFQVLSRH